MKYVKTFEDFQVDGFSIEAIYKRAIDNGKSSSEAKAVSLKIRNLLDKIEAARNPITLYRIIAAKDPKAINKNKLGTHFVLSKDSFTEDFLSSISINKEEKLWVVECKTDKKHIKIGRTIDQNIEFPNEEEIYVEEKAQLTIISITEI